MGGQYTRMMAAGQNSMGCRFTSAAAERGRSASAEILPEAVLENEKRLQHGDVPRAAAFLHLC